jgi:hypothetical protein
MTDAIDIYVLKQVIDDVFNYIKENKIREVSIKKNLYWDMSANERFDISKNVSSICVGSLLDDYHNIERIYSGEQPPIEYHLAVIGVLCDYLSYELTRTYFKIV